MSSIQSVECKIALYEVIFPVLEFRNSTLDFSFYENNVVRRDEP